MKLSTIKHALEIAIDNTAGAKSAAGTRALLNARDEVMELADQCEDGLDTPCTIMSWYAMSNLLNVSTYDDFGKIRKKYKNNRRQETRDYRRVCRDMVCEELTNHQIDSTADFLRDLWDDNEANGSHGQDGAFLRSANDERVVDLQNRIIELEAIIDKLYNHRGITPDDLSAITNCIHE